MTLTESELATITRLSLRHDAEIPELEALDNAYEGCEALEYMHPEVKEEVGDRIRPVRIFWVQLAIDSVVERLFVQGIKSGDKDMDQEIHRVWAANDMDLGLSQAVTDALIMRRSYISVGSNEEDADTPLVCPESPLELYVDVDPRTKKPRAALRRVSDVDPMGSISARYATLYLPDVTIFCDWSGGWRETRRDEHNMGAVPIASLVNRPRTRSSTRTPRNMTVERIGRSSVEPVRDLAQAGTKMMTDMMVAGELVAIPLRGVTDTSPSDFVDQNGNPMTPLRALMGRMLTIPSENARALDFAAAQLSNFTGGARELSQLVGAVTGLPPHYLGTPSDNPASAEAITGSESRLAVRAEQVQVSLNPGVRRTAQLIRRFQTGEWDQTLQSCRVDWRDVRTPTKAQQSDAAVKLYSTQPQPIVPLRQTRESLGFDPETIADMELEDEAMAARTPGAQLANAMNQGLAPQFSDAGATGGPAADLVPA